MTTALATVPLDLFHLASLASMIQQEHQFDNRYEFCEDFSTIGHPELLAFDFIKNLWVETASFRTPYRFWFVGIGY